MLGDWIDGHPSASRLFTRAADILGYDLAAVCRSGPAQSLDTTAVSQPAILVTSLALLEVLRARDAGKPGGCAVDGAVVTAGLSLGEYTALVFAGAIDFDDAVRLVDVRGRAMQACAETRPGSMIAVLGLDRERIAIEPWCDPRGLVRMLFSEAYGFEAFPTTYLIGGDGRIRRVWAGYRNRDEAEIAAALVEALKNEPRDGPRDLPRE
jgi:hypothetical protein